MSQSRQCRFPKREAAAEARDLGRSYAFEEYIEFVRFNLESHNSPGWKTISAWGHHNAVQMCTCTAQI